MNVPTKKYWFFLNRRETDRCTGGQADRQAGRQADGWTDRQMDGQMNGQMNIQMNKQTNGYEQMDGWTGRTE